MAEIDIDSDDVVVRPSAEELKDRAVTSSVKLTKEQVKSVWDIRSPFQRPAGSGAPRARKGYHTTWVREDEVEERKEVGYTNIQERGRDAKGNFKDERPGAETGPIMRRAELGYVNKFEYAMEVPQVLYDQHNMAVAVASHRRYNDSETVMHEYIQNSNRDFGTRKEQLSVRVENQDQVER